MRKIESASSRVKNSPSLDVGRIFSVRTEPRKWAPSSAFLQAFCFFACSPPSWRVGIGEDADDH